MTGRGAARVPLAVPILFFFFSFFARRPRLGNATHELGMMFEAILEPVALRSESDQHAGRTAVRSDDDLVVFREPGTRRLLGARLIDSGSGYNAQNDMPAHFGLPDLTPVDIEVILPRAGAWPATVKPNVDPRDWTGRAVIVAVGR
jgi:hypothetical protein